MSEVSQTMSSVATDQDVLDVAGAVQALADLLKSHITTTGQTLDKNLALAIDWGNIPAHLIESDGTLKGFNFTPADVSNALGALDQLNNYWEGEAVLAGNYGGVFEQLARVITVAPTAGEPRPNRV